METPSSISFVVPEYPLARRWRLGHTSGGHLLIQGKGCISRSADASPLMDIPSGRKPLWNCYFLVFSRDESRYLHLPRKAEHS